MSQRWYTVGRVHYVVRDGTLCLRCIMSESGCIVFKMSKRGTL